MSLGPFEIAGNSLKYKGNKLFKPFNEVRNIPPPDLSKRHIDVKENSKWEKIMRIFNGIHTATFNFMNKRGAILFDLPITTRMISSPGALTGVIPSDVDPFEIKFFDYNIFLTQSSQLYLEFAINAQDVKEVYCWDKSFRREPTDFRHLPEFTHIEYEGRINFEQNLEVQEEFLKNVIQFLLKNNLDDLKFFLVDSDIDSLENLTKLRHFQRIKFFDAFNLLYENTKNKKYQNVTIKNFSAFEEVLLTQIMDNKPIFVTHYIGDEVAFYHAPDPNNSKLVKNADLMFPGFGEIIGSGERVNTREETKAKTKHFELDIDDYRAYIESRDPKNPIIHSGWGMGLERCIQCMLKLPFIWEAKVFPRVHNAPRP